MVTGQTGLLGRVLTNDLKQRGAELVPSERGRASADVTSRREVKKLFENKQLDFVFHLAGLTDIRQSWQTPGRYFDVNIGGTYNMLEALCEREDAGAIPFVFTSSSSVYGITTEASISEDEIPNPVNPYALTKASAESLCRGFHSVFKLATMIARPFYVAGPGLKRGVVYELGRSVAMAETGQKVRNIEVADPDVVIDVVDVRDCCEALEAIAIHGRGGEVYNVCRGKGISVGEIAEIMISSSGSRLRLARTGQKRQADIPRLVGNPAKLRNLGWSPLHSVEEAIAVVLEECRSEVRKHRSRGE